MIKWVICHHFNKLQTHQKQTHQKHKKKHKNKRKNEHKNYISYNIHCKRITFFASALSSLLAGTTSRRATTAIRKTMARTPTLSAVIGGGGREKSILLMGGIERLPLKIPKKLLLNCSFRRDERRFT